MPLLGSKARRGSAWPPLAPLLPSPAVLVLPSSPLGGPELLLLQRLWRCLVLSGQ